MGGMITSLLVHAAALATVGSLSALDWLGAPPQTVEEVAMVPVEPANWERNLGGASLPDERHTTTRKESAPSAKRAPETLPSGQVVDVARGNDQKPEDAKYLAEHDNRVAKETRAREQTPFYQRAMPQATAPDAKPKSDPAQKGDRGTGTTEKTKEEKTQAAVEEVPATLERKKLAALERSDDGVARSREDSTQTRGNSSRLQLQPGTLATQDGHAESDGKVGTPEASGHPPSGVQGEATGAASNDFLDSIETGDGTFLNTREFKYASFFNRVKQRIGEQWSPGDVMRKHDPEGRRFGSQKRITVVDVTLDEQGRAVDLHVSQSCGVDFLDDEAVAAFQRAQPFPNPPSGLLQSDRRIRFRFGFHIDNDPGSRVPQRRRFGH
jgi:TonB family protein